MPSVVRYAGLLSLVVGLAVLAGCGLPASPTSDDVGRQAGTGRTNATPRPTATPCPTQAPCPTCPPLPTPTPTPTIGDRAEPIPFEVTFFLFQEEDKAFSLTLSESYRGEEAWARIIEANQFNDPPPAGMEYLLLYAAVDYDLGPADKALNLDDWDFRIVSRDQILKPTAVVVPEPAFELSFFPGASGGGWMAWTVFEGDPAPLLAYGMAYDGSGGVYFATQP